MKMLDKGLRFIVFLLVLTVFLDVPKVFANESHLFLIKTFSAEKYYRTELYFGMDKPNGGEVSESDWDKFLETEVTPLFPDGLTVLSGYGQFRDSKNNIERENNRVLILFYTKKQRREVNEKIERIRTAYKKLFQQESVLRVDFPKPVEVSF
jgi:hypothetical protein